MNRILNFGSLNMDHVYTVAHIVRPGETEDSLEMEVFPGGKGLNQSVAMARAGAEVYHAGKIGKDGGFLLHLLQSAGVDTSFVETINGYTGKAIIQVEQSTGQNSIVLYGGANRQMTELYIDQVLGAFSGNEILVLQNEVNLVDYILQKAVKKGMRVALNPSPMEEGLKHWELQGVTWLLLNEVEGQALTGEADPARMTEVLLKQYPQMKIILTLGKDGALYRDKESFFQQDIYPTKAMDTTGAGDTFTGYFLAASARRASPQEAMEEASKAAAIAVSRPGAAVSIPTRQEVLAYPFMK